MSDQELLARAREGANYLMQSSKRDTPDEESRLLRARAHLCLVNIIDELAERTGGEKWI